MALLCIILINVFLKNYTREVPAQLKSLSSFGNWNIYWLPQLSVNSNKEKWPQFVMHKTLSIAKDLWTQGVFYSILFAFLLFGRIKI